MARGNNCPKHHPRYKQFMFDGRLFHPFSVQAFPVQIFSDIDELILACHTLYDHVDWS